MFVYLCVNSLSLRPILPVLLAMENGSSQFCQFWQFCQWCQLWSVPFCVGMSVHPVRRSQDIRPHVSQGSGKFRRGRSFRGTQALFKLETETMNVPYRFPPTNWLVTDISPRFATTDCDWCLPRWSLLNGIELPSPQSFSQPVVHTTQLNAK